MSARHGTIGTYVNHRCRCTKCIEAWREYRTAYRAKIRAAGLPDGDPRHGTSSGYRDYGCRCDTCRIGTRVKRAAS